MFCHCFNTAFAVINFRQSFNRKVFFTVFPVTPMICPISGLLAGSLAAGYGFFGNDKIKNCKRE